MNHLGLHNINEFFSDHYLQAVLEGDVKGIDKKWKEQSESPERRLQKLKKPYFALSRDVNDDEDDAKLIALYDRFVAALGYDKAEHTTMFFEHNKDAHVLRALFQYGNDPHLGVIYAKDEGEGVLDSKPLNAAPLAEGEEPFAGTLEDLVNAVFQHAKPPRFLLAFSSNTVMLTERTRWGQGRYLSFDLDELFDRGDRNAFFASAVLLARESLYPGDGEAPLHDTLEENSHKHAHGVSKDLKYGLRESVEILANAYVNYHRANIKTKLFEREEVAAELTRECLRYLYRLLFLFYAEARPELGVVPMKSEAYRNGYSLERLRELELVELYGEEGRQGFHISNSIDKLFGLIFEGYPKSTGQMQELGGETTEEDTAFRIPALRSELFDPANTPMLAKAKFSNETMQRVLSLLSLTRESKKRKSRGRISYATLGINQLGAVYEALLSYSGFFAQEKLFELKPKGKKLSEEDLFTQVYFAPESELKDAEGKDKYHEQEFVMVTTYEGEDKISRKKTYPKGHFVYRLAGRDRERSASYYTPEVLTQCVVKYTLKERLKDIHAADVLDERAHEILALRVLEPAMGSGAFLNEAINQLAANYLQRRQLELEAAARRDGSEFSRLSPAEYSVELQKVKAHLADNQCFGVDLNGTAVELAKVSLWLNMLGPETRVPWFGLQLKTGNSLLGVKRAVFDESQLLKSAKDAHFLKSVPKRHSLCASRSNVGEYDGAGGGLPSGGILHFLLPDEGMVKVSGDKTAKQLLPDACKAMRAWHKGFVKGAFSKSEVSLLLRLTEKVDGLWRTHCQNLADLRGVTRGGHSLYGALPVDGCGDSVAVLEERAQKLVYGEGSAYSRLKLVMDCWAALFCWPLERASELPLRSDYLRALAEVCGVADSDSSSVQAGLFTERAEKGEASFDLLAVKARHSFLGVVEELSARLSFFHWELEFGDVFFEAGGFDVVLGNPPWLKMEWKESGILSEFEPLFGMRKISASDLAKKRVVSLGVGERLSEYVQELSDTLGSKELLNCEQVYPLLKGVQTNLYKCFLTLGWDVGAALGNVGLLHQPAIFDDPRGGALRAAFFPRGELTLIFSNHLMLFAEVHHQVQYTVTVTDVKPAETLLLRAAFSLKHPKTFDGSNSHNGGGVIPGLKDDENKWDLRGHAKRIVNINTDALETFAALYDEEGTPALEAKLPVLHSQDTLRVLEKFLKVAKLGERSNDWYSTEMWHETNAQKDGTIKRAEKECENPSEWIAVGPHFFVGRPFNKTPNPGCKHNQDYSSIDLTTIPDDYLPRTLYSPACGPAEYKKRTPTFNGRPVTDYFRQAHRTMASPSNERTLFVAILPPGAAHINGVTSIVFADNKQLVSNHALQASVVFDFLIRSTGKQNIHGSEIGKLPLAKYEAKGAVRALRLNCLTNHYAPLWEELYESAFKKDAFTKEDPRLPAFNKLTKTWTRDTPWRTDYARRQALVELDVLAALALDITLEELCTIYRVQFPVMYGYEKETFYDKRGHIVFTINRGLAGVGLSRDEWTQVQHLEEGQKMPKHFQDDPRTAGFVPPFDKCDREADYALAFEVFGKREQ